MNSPKSDYLTLADLVLRWDTSIGYIHDLIGSGKIIPAVHLTNAERYPGGEFRGGRAVGDIVQSVHRSYADYFTSTTIGEANHYEDWPRCVQVVYCHLDYLDEYDDSYVNGFDSDYSFKFFSESPDRTDTKKWFYFDNGNEIKGKSEGEKRFRFRQEQIELYEAEYFRNENGPISKLTDSDKNSKLSISVFSNSQTSVIHQINPSRISKLNAEIETARKRAMDHDDCHSVWTELIKMACLKEGCLIGVNVETARLANEESIEYEMGEEIHLFKKKNLYDRMSRKKKISKPM